MHDYNSYQDFFTIIFSIQITIFVEYNFLGIFIVVIYWLFTIFKVNVIQKIVSHFCHYDIEYIKEYKKWKENLKVQQIFNRDKLLMNYRFKWFQLIYLP